jgi:hypothetical protein
MSARKQPTEDTAEMCWLALEQAGEPGLSLLDLMAETGLTRNQVKAGIREINRIKQLAHEQPIMVNPHTWAYVLPELYKDLLPWTYNRLTDMKTRLVTEKARLGAASGKWPKEVPGHVAKDVDRLIEDLSDLIDTLG